MNRVQIFRIFCSPDQVQMSLFNTEAVHPEDSKLMQAIDVINCSGQAQIWFGGQRPRKDWFMKQSQLSPAYTTRWCSIPIVK